MAARLARAPEVGAGVNTATSSSLSNGQADALMRVDDWVKGRGSGEMDFRLGGLAGVGKTFLLGEVSRHLMSQGVHVEFCAPTGRAASVLASKTGQVARTVHSILKYRPGGDEHNDDCDRSSRCACAAAKSFTKYEETDYSRGAGTVILVDEASMVTRWMYEELMGLGARILFCGDFGQLAPVGDAGFSVVAEHLLDARLTEIVRQEQGNPIIELAWEVRNGAAWTPQEKDTDQGSVKVIDRSPASVPIGYEPGRMVLCYTNKMRVNRNYEIRRRRWGADVTNDPIVGDSVICLRNDPIRGIFNGMRGEVTQVKPYTGDDNLLMADIEMEGGGRYFGPVVRAQFGSPTLLANKYGALFDHGACITTHKSQGSEAQDVVVLGESLGRMSDDEKRRWRYTAVTRGKSNVTVIANCR